MDSQTATPPDLERADGVGPPRQQRRSSISSLLFLTFVLFLMTGGGNEEATITSQNHYRDALESLKYQQSNYTAWLNGTASNFTLPSEDYTLTPFVHSLLPSPPPPRGYTSYYHNLSGFVNGISQFHNLTALPKTDTVSPLSEHSPTFWHQFAEKFVAHANINLTEAAERIGTYNWTGIDKAMISLLELQHQYDGNALDSHEELVLMHGKLDLSNPRESVELQFQIDGVHFPKNGSFVGFAAPKGQFSDLRELPSLVPLHIRNATARAVAPELDRRITRLRKMVDSGSVDVETSSKDDTHLPMCDFTFHFQLKPSFIPPHLMRELESELHYPTGISTVRAPNIVFDAVLVSKSCAIMIEIRDATGMKAQRFWRKTTTYAGFSFLVYLFLLVSLTRQLGSNVSRTPAGLSRISRWSFIAQAGADAISFVGHLTFGIFSDNRASLSLIAPGFLACILLVYQIQYAILINRIQGPEDAALRDATTRASRSDHVPLAHTQTSTRIPLVTRMLGNFRVGVIAEPQARFWFFVVISLVFFLNMILSPMLALVAVGTIYSLLWAPQIVRSARRGSRPALNKDYLIGSTAGRMFFALYIFGCPENVLGTDPSPYVVIIVILTSIQVLVILGQDWLGPSFFLPKGWVTPDVYDYHPHMATIDLEAPNQTLGDCSICMDSIVMHQESPGGAITTTSVPLITSSSIGIQRTYAVAPCHHIFHTNCLEQWLAIKNICPQCRRPLPPL